MARLFYGKTRTHFFWNFSTSQFSIPKLQLQPQREEEEEESTMKPMVVDYLADMEEQGSTMAMDVDDVDAIDMFGEGPLGGGEHLRLADSDFFNLFQDDFDDSDIN
ncbi:hypothetical protein MTR67_050152 [Solanum verrucosum]|uniref:Small acidic protein 1 n=1 Tax=Solanum verrucosum TaxID=315347 RepID=A0AAF0V1U9_SOLVR|nr:hypothetical protein MTR67_050152 [Solanum verrucosum]